MPQAGLRARLGCAPALGVLAQLGDRPSSRESVENCGHLGRGPRGRGSRVGLGQHRGAMAPLSTWVGGGGGRTAPGSRDPPTCHRHTDVQVAKGRGRARLGGVCINRNLTKPSSLLDASAPPTGQNAPHFRDSWAVLSLTGAPALLACSVCWAGLAACHGRGRASSPGAPQQGGGPPPEASAQSGPPWEDHLVESAKEDRTGLRPWPR